MLCCVAFVLIRGGIVYGYLLSFCFGQKFIEFI